MARTIRWAEHWNQFPQPYSEALPRLRDAVLAPPLAHRREVALGDPWAQLLAAGSAPDNARYVELLRDTFGADAAAMRDAILEQVDIEGAIAVSASFSLDVIAGHTSSGQPVFDVHHPAVEILVYARLVRELGDEATAHALVGRVHARLLALVNSTYEKRAFAKQARQQVLALWSALIDSGATAAFGYPEHEAWAKRVAAAVSKKRWDEAPPAFGVPASPGVA